MPWTILGDCVSGTSHRARNLPCQDACRFRPFGPRADWLVVVAADGAGSSSHSQVGANLVCEEWIKRVEGIDPESLFSREAITELLHEVRETLVAEAQRLSLVERDLACTVLLAIVGPASAAFAQIGDGAIVINEGQEHRVIFWPEPGEYANATDFLTDRSFRETIRFEMVHDSIAEVAVLTDGLQRLALDFAARTVFSGFFQPLFQALRSTNHPDALLVPFHGFLDSPRVNERTDDDKTLVLAIHIP